MSIPSSSFLKLAEIWHDLSDDAAHAAEGMLHPSVPDLIRYVKLSPRDQAYVTWFLEVAASEGLWHADRAFEAVEDWNAKNPHSLRTTVPQPIEQIDDWGTPYPTLRGREVYGRGGDA